MHRPAARRSSGALDVQLSVVVAVISYPGPVDRLNNGRGGAARGCVESVVVGVDRVREAGGQHHRAAPVQQQRLLAARAAGQDAVYAEHPGGHHTGATVGKQENDGGNCSVKYNFPDRKISVPFGKSSLKLRHDDSGGNFSSLHARLRELVSGVRTAGFNGTH